MSKRITYKKRIAKGFIKRLGNAKPNREQIALVEKTLFRAAANRNPTFNIKLTENETCCLYWAAQGCSVRDTARIMKIQCSTIKLYREAIKHKLHCNTIAQAVFEGICFGYVLIK